MSVIEPGSQAVVDATRGGVLLEVENLSVMFDTPRGTVRSVVDISFTL